MKIVASFAFVAIILTTALFVPSSDVHADAGSYCDGHRDGHKAGSETFGMDTQAILDARGIPVVRAAMHRPISEGSPRACEK